MVFHSGKCFMCPTWVTTHRLAVWCPEGFIEGPEGHRQEARAVKTVKVSGWVAKLAWDKTVGGVHCTVVVHCTQSLQTGSQLGPNLAGVYDC